MLGGDREFNRRRLSDTHAIDCGSGVSREAGIPKVSGNSSI